MSAGVCAMNKEGLPDKMSQGEKVGKLKALYENLEGSGKSPLGKTDPVSSRSNSLETSSREKIKTILTNSITELHSIVQSSSSHHQASALPAEDRVRQSGSINAALPKDLSLAGTLEVHRDAEHNVGIDSPPALKSSLPVSRGVEFRIDGLQEDSMNQERDSGEDDASQKREAADAVGESRAGDETVDLDLFEQCGDDARMDHQRECENAGRADGSAEQKRGLDEEALHNFLRNQMSMHSVSAISDKTNSGGSPRMNSPHGFSQEELHFAAIDAGDLIDSSGATPPVKGLCQGENASLSLPIKNSYRSNLLQETLRKTWDAGHDCGENLEKVVPPPLLLSSSPPLFGISLVVLFFVFLLSSRIPIPPHLTLALEQVILQSVKVVVSSASVCMLLGESCVPQSESEVVKYTIKLLKQFIMREGFLSAPSGRSCELDPSYSHGKALMILRALSRAAQGSVGAKLQQQILRSEIGMPLLAIVVSSSLEWDGPLTTLKTKSVGTRCSSSEDHLRDQVCCVLKESINLLIILFKHEHLQQDHHWLLSDFLHTNFKDKLPFWWNWQANEESFLSQRAGGSEEEEVLDRSNDDGNCLFLHQLVKTSLNAARKRYEEDSNINIMCTRLSHMVEDLV
ncbi:hypothetical protein GUITHDRAFT_132403 [Guillardia theta CCMP2712]|uniref:Uncharacterized protein n=1 Tax=Guillardia theta (strain CCMP2712) TaxID=905079 RepID=L1K089_GUITC|nr:hypothetical protein GUITHDRAFT_132403 [Guillardia theta CCMP2712]EKX53974.1 hypothetical protein GUITHDRAFT_132403 [Guillardia theta CCMP2712]|eukprot:XP_005840954.1 hypothetical protein GUITHDRAFT_132403 [Guillardia theta CCMP2712]